MSNCPVCDLPIESGQSRLLAVINAEGYMYCHRACIDTRVVELEAKNTEWKKSVKEALYLAGKANERAEIAEKHWPAYHKLEAENAELKKQLDSALRAMFTEE